MYWLGFAASWIEMVMRCVESVSYSFLVNGNLTGWVVPKRGIRQGDPISPYLFLLCVEGLSALITHRERSGNIHGIKICPEAPSVHNFLFADDSFVFTKATFEECQQVMNILKLYERASGQVINLNKSSVVFSKNVKDDVQLMVTEMFGVKRADKHERYLGLPTFVGRNNVASFSSLKDRLWQKLEGWRGKLLSGARREVLIKVVA